MPVVTAMRGFDRSQVEEFLRWLNAKEAALSRFQLKCGITRSAP